jgi:F-type H+-transporting ATPase subunit alpha
MGDAENSLHKTIPDIPADVIDKIKADKELSDKDRETILNIARKALASYQQKSESVPKPEAETEGKTGSEAQTGEKPQPETQNKGKPEPEAKE